jgi:hypothetical protein
VQDDENADVFKTWYPPLEKTLSCLSKLYRCLEQAVFTGLAQEAVEVCSLSIQVSKLENQIFLTLIFVSVSLVLIFIGIIKF